MAEEKVFGVKPKVTDLKKEEVKTENYGEMFQLVTREGVTYITTCNAIVTRNKFKTVSAAKKYIDSKPWDLIVNTACACYDAYKSLNNNK